MWSIDIECKYMFMFPLKNLARNFRAKLKQTSMTTEEVIGVKYVCILD